MGERTEESRWRPAQRCWLARTWVPVGAGTPERTQKNTKGSGTPPRHATPRHAATGGSARVRRRAVTTGNKDCVRRAGRTAAS